MSKPTRKVESPTIEPPKVRTQLYAIGGAPSALPEVVLEETAAARVSAPTLVPPTEAEVVRAEEGIAAWLNDKKVEALWSDHANCNSWISIPGVGWKRLFNANESALVSMTLLSAHAEQTNANVNVRIEADGMVHEIYVW
jgi:hypothetical protein